MKGYNICLSRHAAKMTSTDSLKEVGGPLTLSPSLPQHIIYSVKFFISYAIPDVSKITKSKIKREKYLTQKLLHESHLKDLTKNMGLIAERMGEVVDNSVRPKLE